MDTVVTTGSRNPFERLKKFGHVLEEIGRMPPLKQTFFWTLEALLMIYWFWILRSIFFDVYPVFDLFENTIARCLFITYFLEKIKDSLFPGFKKKMDEFLDDNNDSFWEEYEPEEYAEDEENTPGNQENSN